MKPDRIILASTSPRRSKLLAEAGIEFEVVPSDATELHHEHLTAVELCLINAHRKARSVAKRFPDALVIGADTLVWMGATVLGKPGDLAEAQRMLHALQGKTHHVSTGVCLLHLRGHSEQLFAETTGVTFHPLTAAQIRAYVTSVPTLDKAGAYAIQEQGDRLVEEVCGSYSNVIGLPVRRVVEEIRKSLAMSDVESRR